MNKLNKSFLLMLAIALIAVSCKKDDPPAPPVTNPTTLDVVFAGKSGATNLEYNTTYDNPAMNRKYQISHVAFYISDLTLVKSDDSEVLLSEIELVDFAHLPWQKTAHSSDGVSFSYQVSPGSYKGIKFGLGVKQALNHEDPSQWQGTGHPLDTDYGMHWSWTSGYQFMQFDGLIDTSAANDGSQMDLAFVYHTGWDTLYRQVDFTNGSFNIPEGQETPFNIIVDVDRFFYAIDTLDVYGMPVSHSMPIGSAAFEMGRKVTENAVAAMSH